MGPLTEDEIRSLIESRKIVQQTYVRRKGMDDWQVAGEQPDLANAFPPPLPTPPVPPKVPRPAFQPAEAKPDLLLTCPVTGKTATIGRTWQPQPIDTNGGSAFYFVSNEFLSEAIFGHETLASDKMGNSAYANAIKDVIASEIAINTEWRTVQVNGMPALRATGTSKKAADAAVELTVAVSGRDAWRTLMFTRGSSSAQMNEKDRFVNAMFGTAK
ncbi:DUF4339 domain-containing protein [Rhizobium sp. K102]|jgi:hypothetical protein|nr:DUF4339 domain-containing protein [Rhizobium sp. K102]